MAVITGSNGTFTTSVLSDGSLQVRPTSNTDASGFITASGEVTDGSSGVARLTRPFDVSPDFRVRVGADSLLWDDVFNHGTFNVSKYLGVTSTMTIALASGFMSFNAGNSVTSGHVARVQTYRTFPVNSTFPIYVDIWAMISQDPQPNSVIEFGLGYATGTATPTDGVFFRLSGASSFQGVTNYNGSETTTGDLTSFIPASGVVYHYLIVIQPNSVEFWRDDVMMARVNTPVASGGPSFSGALPLLLRMYNSGTVTIAQQFRVSKVAITNGDINSNRLWGTAMVGMGQGSYNAPDGQAANFTANYTNAAAPVSATLAAATPSYTTLGGQWQFAAVAGAETDFPLFGYTVPAGTATQPGKNLIIRGIRIETINTGAAVATTPTSIQWGIAVGSTSGSLATVDSATAGTRAPRRLTLGIQSFVVGAAIGQMASPVDVNLDAPIVCEPGTVVHILMRQFLGTATASQIIRGTVTINGYFE